MKTQPTATLDATPWAAPLRSEAFVEDIVDLLPAPPIALHERQARWLIAAVPAMVALAGVAVATVPPIG